jgi:hypothetical protein
MYFIVASFSVVMVTAALGFVFCFEKAEKPQKL